MGASFATVGDADADEEEEEEEGGDAAALTDATTGGDDSREEASLSPWKLRIRRRPNSKPSGLASRSAWAGIIKPSMSLFHYVCLFVCV